MSTMSSDNQDQQTLSQIEAIEKEIASTQPLTTALQQISTLLQLYTTNISTNVDSSSGGGQSGNKQDDTVIGNVTGANKNFIDGSKYLIQKYTSWRRVRGDGNCYYRAFLYSLCETLSTGGDQYREEYDRVHKLVTSSIDEVVQHGYDRSTIEIFHEELVDLLTNYRSNNKNDKTLHSTLNEENSTSDYSTWYLRLLTSIHLQKDPNRFVHFLTDGYFDIPSFCKAEVEPMGKECEMVQVLALAEYIGVRVSIEYLDGNDLVGKGGNDGEGMGKLVMHEFGPEDAALVVRLLYRPGHYDILY